MKTLLFLSILSVAALAADAPNGPRARRQIPANYSLTNRVADLELQVRDLRARMTRAEVKLAPAPRAVTNRAPANIRFHTNTPAARRQRIPK